MEQTYLTIKEVMELLKISRPTVDRWIRKDAFPEAIIFEGVIRIPLSDIENLKHKKA